MKKNGWIGLFPLQVFWGQVQVAPVKRKMQKTNIWNSFQGIFTFLGEIHFAKSMTKSNRTWTGTQTSCSLVVLMETNKFNDCKSLFSWKWLTLTRIMHRVAVKARMRVAPFVAVNSKPLFLPPHAKRANSHTLVASCCGFHFIFFYFVLAVGKYSWCITAKYLPTAKKKESTWLLNGEFGCQFKLEF